MKVQDKKWLQTKLERLKLIDSYRIEESVESVAQRFGINQFEIMKLNSNENFFLSKSTLLGFMQEIIHEYDPRIYPQEGSSRLKKRIGEYLTVATDCIMIGNGSDDFIERIMRLFLEKDDQALSIAPTFSIYRYSASLLGVKYLEAPLKKDFSLDTEKILTMSSSKTRLLFLCSPNNPTANQFEIDDILLLADEFPGIVVIDEAYVEFADHSVVPLIEQFENLIVLRTFSKAFGLAGLRLGYALANSDLATTLSQKTQMPYPVSSIALKMGLKLLDNINIVNKAVKQLKDERGELVKELNEINGVKAFNSQTNFLLFQTRKRSNEVYQDLLVRGILIKNLGQILHLDNCFRTTVGSHQMNTKLLEALEEICGV